MLTDRAPVRVALGTQMRRWHAALMTFKASMALAGIEAAKECGFPQEMLT